MCVVPSWIETKEAFLFLTDKDALEHGIDWEDATGHTAILKVWADAKGKAGEGIGKHTPQVVMDAIRAGKLNRIAAAGDARFDMWVDVPWPKVGGYLDLRALTALPEKVTFPKECGSLYLDALKDRSRVPVYKNGKLQEKKP